MKPAQPTPAGARGQPVRRRIVMVQLGAMAAACAMPRSALAADPGVPLRVSAGGGVDGTPAAWAANRLCLYSCPQSAGLGSAGFNAKA